MSKVRVNISLEKDTIEHLKEYAKENYTTVSQVITELAWTLKIKNPQVKGQQKLNLDNKN